MQAETRPRWVFARVPIFAALASPARVGLAAPGQASATDDDYWRGGTWLMAEGDTLAWTEGKHYIMYPNVPVVAGQPRVVMAMPGGMVALISGRQAVARDEVPPLAGREASSP